MDKFVNEEFDTIITLCDNAAVSCFTFPGQGRRIHWSIEDPVGAVGSTEERLVLFRRTRNEIKKRIEELEKTRKEQDFKYADITKTQRLNAVMTSENEKIMQQLNNNNNYK